jgi:hypothetical protein
MARYVESVIVIKPSFDVGKPDSQEQCDPCDSDNAADLETTEHPLILRMQKEAADLQRWAWSNLDG